MPKLQNDRWERFAQEYIVDWNQTEAARRAGYAAESQNIGTLNTIGWENRNRPLIQARIKELLQERRKEYDVTVERTIQEMARVAFADITSIIDSFEGGVVTYKSLINIPVRVRPAIKKISQTVSGVTVEFHDKLGALEQLAKYFGMYEKDNKQKVPVGPQIYLPDNGRGDQSRPTQDGVQPSQWPPAGDA